MVGNYVVVAHRRSEHRAWNPRNEESRVTVAMPEQSNLPRRRMLVAPMRVPHRSNMNVIALAIEDTAQVGSAVNG